MANRWRNENSWWRNGWCNGRDWWDSDGWRSRNNWAPATAQAAAAANVQQAAPRGGTRAQPRAAVAATPKQMGHLAAPQAAVAAVAPAGITRSRIAGEGMELTPSLQLRLRSIGGPSEDDLPDGEVFENCDMEGYVKRPRLIQAVMDNVADNSDDSLDSETIACNPWDSLALRRAGLTER